MTWGDGKGKRENRARSSHFTPNRTNVPAHSYSDLTMLLKSLKKGVRLLSYLNLTNIYEEFDAFVLRQLPVNM